MTPDPADRATVEAASTEAGGESPSPARQDPPQRPKMKRPPSRPQRWADAIAECRAAADKVEAAASELNDALSDLRDVQSEYSEWRDSMDGKFAGSALAEKLDAIADLDLEVEVDVSNATEAIDNAEGCDLPLGFGRD